MTSKKTDSQELAVPVTPAIDRNAILAENREIAKGMWSGKLSANEQKALNNICLLYGLDPLQKQIVVLSGTMYITKSGLINIAHQDENPPEGIEVVPATKQEREDSGAPADSQYWKAIVWKRGGTKPFIEFGEANAKNVNLHNKDWRVISDMAKTRAINRALRNAYRIGLTSYEEVDTGVTESRQEFTVAMPQISSQSVACSKVDEVVNNTVAPIEAGGDTQITDAQRVRLYTIATNVNKPPAEVKAYLKETYNITSAKELLKRDYEDVIRWLEDAQKKIV